MMCFQAMQLRLIAAIKERVRRGSLTERGLAHAIGMSQPHIHNVLKGARILSPPVADRILQTLDLSVFDLLEAEELAAARPHSPPEAAYREVSLLGAKLGPGWPYPASQDHLVRYPFPAADLAELEDPVAARLAPDPLLNGVFCPDDLLLLDRSPRWRSKPQPGTWYVVCTGSCGLVRMARVERAGCELHLYPHPPAGPDCISLAGRNILDVVQAKVVWFGREMGLRPSAARPADKTRQEH